MTPQESARLASLHQELDRLLKQRGNLRTQERGLRGSGMGNVQANPAAPGTVSLTERLASILPRHLIPGNVGPLSQVAYPFNYPVEVDFGTDPTLTPQSSQTGSFQVSQEAGFLLTSVSCNFDAPMSESGALGPYSLTLRDRQSSRQLNDLQIPVQALGRNSRPSLLATPWLVLPNAFVEVVVGCSLVMAAGESMATTGSGRLQFLFGGIRVRIPEASQILSTVYSEVME